MDMIKMKKLIDKVQQRKVRLKAKISLQEELAAAFIFAKDQCCQMWLDEYLLVDNHSEVDNSNLNFNDIINKILLGEYSANLPKTFIFAIKKAQREESDQDE
eukprot:6522869-Ditylum_brightwellii.AAC.1